MHRFCPKLVHSWNHYGTLQSLRKCVCSTNLIRSYSSLYSTKTSTKHSGFSHILHNSSNSKFLHTGSTSDENIDEQNSSPSASKELPVPQFKNVLEHLKQLSSLFSSNSSENADFCSLLDQLGTAEKFSSQLNNALKQRMSAQADWLVQQSQIRLQNNFLQNRSPLPVWSNSALLYPNLTPQKVLSANFMIEYISATILSILDFRSKLGKDSLEKFRSVFYSSRNPGTSVDSHNVGPHTSEYSIVLSRQSNFFQVILNDQMAQGEIFFVLKKVVEFILNYKNDGLIPFGSLSALPRTDATFGYSFLNESGLKLLQNSQLLINLDQIETDPTQDIDQEELAKQILVSNQENIGNRWFDKSIQLIIILGGKDNLIDQIMMSGICFEKSLVSPESVVELMQHGIGFLAKFKPIEIKPESLVEDNKLMIKLQKLDFIQPGKQEIIKSAINDFAMKKYSILVESFKLNTFEFADYGHEFIESINCEPEAWIQIAVGLAYYNLKQLNNNPNSSISAIRFEGLTLEMLDFFEDTHSEDKLRIAMESYQFHQELAKNGYNINNILRIYEQLIVEEGISDVKAKHIFKSLLSHSVISQINHPLICITNSIGTTSTGLVELTGPLVPGGFACSYQFRNDGSILFTIGHHHHQGDDRKDDSSDIIRGNGQEVLREFTEFLYQALRQMKSIIEC